MRPIPIKLRQEIASDPFMERCCVTGSRNVSWEHCWNYGGKQINEKWAIVPLERSLNTSSPGSEIKDRCRLISLNRATEEDLAKYPKKDWKMIKKYLEKKYGKTEHKADVDE